MECKRSGSVQGDTRVVSIIDRAGYPCIVPLCHAKGFASEDFWQRTIAAHGSEQSIPDADIHAFVMHTDRRTRNSGNTTHTSHAEDTRPKSSIRKRRVMDRRRLHDDGYISTMPPPTRREEYDTIIIGTADRDTFKATREQTEYLECMYQMGVRRVRREQLLAVGFKGEKKRETKEIEYIYVD